MFQPLLRADFNLGCQTFTAAEHRSANGRRERRGDQRLSAYYDEDAKLLRITVGFVNSIQLAAFHRSLILLRTDIPERRQLQHSAALQLC